MNIGATSLPICVLQLVVMPLVASRIADEYGLLVTLVAVFTLFTGTFGNSINNVRLIQHDSYEKRGDWGDFSAIAIVSCILSSAFVMGLTAYYCNGLSEALVMMGILSFLVTAREYLIVAYRIELNFKAIFINNAILSFGYLLGFALFWASGVWELVYLSGYILSLIYVVRSTSLWKEPLSFTAHFRETLTSVAHLSLSNFLSNAITYADRLLIYPLLGAYSVSIYYVATLFGKMASMIVTPVNGVILSYLAKYSKKPDALFKMTLSLGLLICIFGYGATMLCSRPVLGFLYPQFVDEAMAYVYVTTATAFIRVLVTIVNPYVLKFFPMSWQTKISGLYLAIYVVACFGLYYPLGLMGFCIGVLLTMLVKLAVTLFVYFRANTLSVA